MNAVNIAPRSADAADEYRYKHFTTRLLFRDLRFREDAAAPGDAFPEFKLLTTDGSSLVNDDVFGDKPVIFIFTLPKFDASSTPAPITATAITASVVRPAAEVEARSCFPGWLARTCLRTTA